MTLTSLKALTWGTVTGAVVSALLLASTETRPSWSGLRRGVPAVRSPSVVERTGAQPASPTGVLPVTESQRPLNPR